MKFDTGLLSWNFLKIILPVFLLFIAIVIGRDFLIRKLKKNKASAKEKRPWPYRGRFVMSGAETRLFQRLQEAFPHMIVLSQVALNRVVEFPETPEWQEILGGKSLDYVVCQKKDSSILFVAELDDSSHTRKDRWESDEIKNSVLKDAGIPLIRWNTRNMPDVTQIREEVRLQRLTEH